MKEDLSSCAIGTGLLNYMIGGTVLILPILAMKSGYVNTILICLSMGYISYYTAILIVAHLGKSKDIKSSILAHFSNETIYLKVYSILIWLSFIPTFIVYFQLIVNQISGLIGQKDWISYAAIAFLIVLILIVRYFNYSE